MNYLTVAILSTLLTIFSFLYFYFAKPKKLDHIPSVSLYENIKAISSTIPFDQKIVKYDRKLPKHKVQARIASGTWEVVVSSPKAARAIYTDTATFAKVIPSDFSPNSLGAKFMGINLVFSNHSVWKQHRRILNPPFKKQFDTKIFGDCTRRFFHQIEDKFEGKYVDVHKYMQRITMDAMGKGIMGVDFNSVSNENVPFIDNYNEVTKGLFDPFYFTFHFFDKPWNPFRSHIFKKLKWIENYFEPILSDKRKLIKSQQDNGAEFNANEDILTSMLKASEQEGSGFTDKEIRDNIMIFILAGHDTTAFALSAALHFLATYQDIQDKARTEVMKAMELDSPACGNIEECNWPTFEQTKKMDYLLAVMKETMRFYPSIAELPARINEKDVVLDGVHIPAKTQIILSTYTLHHDPEFWVKPEEFHPERFLKNCDEKMAAPSDPMIWTPFGGGTRSCIGMNFSLLEQKVVLAMILTRYKVVYPETSRQTQGSTLKLTHYGLLSPADLKLNFIPLKY